MENIKIGDIFVSSWGYDQTNIDFYQVVARTAKMVTIRKINAKHTPAYTMASYVEPMKDSFLDEDTHYGRTYGRPSRHKIQFYDGKPYLRIKSYASARLWDGERRTETYTG